MNIELAPIIVFGYNRPDHLRRTLEALARNPEAEESLLFIYCDGPRENAGLEQVKSIEAVRKVAREKTWCAEVVVKESEKNMGLASSVIKGVSDVVNEYGKVIVLEDDHVTSPWFLRYMNDALTLYADSTDVVCVSGYVYPVKGRLPETFFLRGADCWGWATWKRGWSEFDGEGQKLLQKLEDSGEITTFDFNGTYPYSAMLKDEVEGKISSWAILWYVSAFLKNKYTLYPGISLVQNIGVDGTGTHSGTSAEWNVRLSEKRVLVARQEIKDNALARRKFEEFFSSLRKVLLWNRLMRRLKILFS